MKSRPIATAMAATPKATTEANSDDWRNYEGRLPEGIVPVQLGVGEAAGQFEGCFSMTFAWQ